MQSLLGNSSISDTVLKQMWLDKVQPEIVRILATLTDEVDIRKLAIIADKVADTAPTRHISSTTTSDDLTSDLNQKLQFLSSELQKISLRLDEVQDTPRRSRGNSIARHEHSRPHSASCRRHHHHDHHHHQHGNCWYHEVFGARAQRNANCDVLTKIHLQLMFKEKNFPGTQ